MSTKDQDFNNWLNTNFMRVGILRNVSRTFFLIGFLHLAYFLFFGWTTNIEVNWTIHNTKYSVSGVGMNEDLFYLDYLPGDWVKGSPIRGSCQWKLNMCIANGSRWASVIFLLILPFLIPFVHHYFVYEDEKSKNIKDSYVKKTNSHDATYKSPSSSESSEFKTTKISDKEIMQSTQRESEKSKQPSGFKVIKKLKD